jgi:hypothetical protein
MLMAFLENGGIFVCIPVGMFLLFWFLQKFMGLSTNPYKAHMVEDNGPIDREKASKFKYVPTPVKPEDLRDDPQPAGYYTGE